MTQGTAPSPLRQMALDYAEGRSERADYLRARRQFLDALSATPVDPPRADAATTGGPPARTPGDTDPADHRPASLSPPHHPPPPSPRAGRSAWIPLLGAGLALPVAGLLWYWLSGGVEPPARGPEPAPLARSGAPPSAPPVAMTPPPAPTVSADQDAAVALRSPPAASLFIEELRGGHWGPPERARFLSQWQRLAPTAQALAREGYAFRGLEEDLRMLIDAERAAGGGETAVRGLLDFAHALGIDLPDPAPPAETRLAATPAAPVPAAGDSRPLAAGDGASQSPPGRPAADAPGEPPAPVAPPLDQRAAAPSSAPVTRDNTALAAKVAPPPAVEADSAKGRPAPADPRPAPPLAAAKTEIPEPPVPSVMERLAASAGGDPCASAAARAQTAVYDCLDPFSATAAAGLRLKVIPAETPFVITAEHYDLNKWCARDPSPCPPSADASAKARAYSAWLGRKTGRTYRPATAADLQQAAAYGMSLPQDGRSGLRLVRELGRPQSKGEAALLERWWHRHHRPGP